MTGTTGRVQAIHRHPVKGLNADALPEVPLEAGAGLPQDRRFALALADSPFDPTHPVWLRKTHFLMLMRDEALARVDAHYDEADHRLVIRQGGRARVEADLEDPAGRDEIESFFQDLLGLEAPPRLVEAPGHMFSDNPDQLVSVINLATVREIEAIAGIPVDARRFRANVYVEDLPAFEEAGWVGNPVRLGSAQARAVSTITRCAATNVNPETALRDLNLPALLKRAYGHIECGVYLEVTDAGAVAVGDRIDVEA